MICIYEKLIVLNEEFNIKLTLYKNEKRVDEDEKDCNHNFFINSKGKISISPCSNIITKEQYREILDEKYTDKTVTNYLTVLKNFQFECFCSKSISKDKAEYLKFIETLPKSKKRVFTVLLSTFAE